MVILQPVQTVVCDTNHFGPLMTEQNTPARQIIRKQGVCTLTGLSPATIDRMRVRGDFPAPIRLGVQAVGWELVKVQQWLESRPLAHHFCESVLVK